MSMHLSPDSLLARSWLSLLFIALLELAGAPLFPDCGEGGVELEIEMEDATDLEDPDLPALLEQDIQYMEAIRVRITSC